MREKILSIWESLGMGRDTFLSHKEDDLGRLEIIENRIRDLMELRKEVETFKNNIKYNYYMCD